MLGACRSQQAVQARPTPPATLESLTSDVLGRGCHLTLPPKKLKSYCVTRNEKQLDNSMEVIIHPKTNITPEKWWLGDDPFLLERPVFRCELLVLGRVCTRFIPIDMANSQLFLQNLGRSLLTVPSGPRAFFWDTR